MTDALDQIGVDDDFKSLTLTKSSLSPVPFTNIRTPAIPIGIFLNIKIKFTSLKVKKKKQRRLRCNQTKLGMTIERNGYGVIRPLRKTIFLFISYSTPFGVGNFNHIPNSVRVRDGVQSSYVD